MTPFNLPAYLVEKRKAIDEALAGYLLKLLPGDTRLKAAMVYALMAGGKRLRPILCIAAAEGVGRDMDAVMAGACAVEMIHTYSLIHDDLPAMDDDFLRRGKPTCHVAFDEATAILAGDALLTLAFELLGTEAVFRSWGAEKALKAIQILSRAAGPSGMIQGQMEDVAAEGGCLDLDALRNLHRLKTGALIQGSAEMGTVLGDGTLRQVEDIRRYAAHLGMAFQVTDDILNVEGDPRVMGKAAGTDRLKQKCTFPSLMGLEGSRTFARQCIDSALRALEDFDNRADPLRALARYVLERRR